ncbi:hypothetical protein PG989_000325 [Apiospora arundinis]
MTFMVRSWDDVVRLPTRPKLPAYLMDGKRCNEAVDRYYGERNPRFRTLLHGDGGDRVPGLVGVPLRLVLPRHRLPHDGHAEHRGPARARDGDLGLLSRDFTQAGRAQVRPLQRPGGHGRIPALLHDQRHLAHLPRRPAEQERIDSLCERTVATYDDPKVIDVILNQPKPAAAAAKS